MHKEQEKLAYAAGMYQALGQKGPNFPTYKHFVISKRAIEAGSEKLGALPGDLEDKLSPQFENFISQHDDLLLGKAMKFRWMLANSRNSGPYKSGGFNPMPDKNNPTPILQEKNIGFLQGASISGAYILIDESQNIERDVGKLIATRPAQGSKLVLCGDVKQTLRGSGCSETKNTLLETAFHFMRKSDRPYFGIINFKTPYRNQASNDALDMPNYRD